MTNRTVEQRIAETEAWYRGAPDRNRPKDGTVTIAGVKMTDNAFESLASVACTKESRERMVQGDVADLRNGTETTETLLAECLDGCEEAFESGWREYAAAIVSAATS